MINLPTPPDLSFIGLIVFTRSPELAAGHMLVRLLGRYLPHHRSRSEELRQSGLLPRNIPLSSDDHNSWARRNAGGFR